MLNRRSLIKNFIIGLVALVITPFKLLPTKKPKVSSPVSYEWAEYSEGDVPKYWIDNKDAIVTTGFYYVDGKLLTLNSIPLVFDQQIP